MPVYCTEEILNDVTGKWEVKKSFAFFTLEEANKFREQNRALFGASSKHRYVISMEKPNSFRGPTVGDVEGEK
jgi:hypothetical protein